MRSFLKFIVGGGIALFLLMVFVPDSAVGTYYYNTNLGGKVTIELKSDKTATVTIIFSSDAYPVTRQTSWFWSGDVIIIEDGQGAIRDGYSYTNGDDARAKRNGIKLTKL